MPREDNTDQVYKGEDETSPWDKNNQLDICHLKENLNWWLISSHGLALHTLKMLNVLYSERNEKNLKSGILCSAQPNFINHNKNVKTEKG